MEAIKAHADEKARDVMPDIEDIRAHGHTSLGDIARELNERQVLTPRGGKWYRMTVKRVLERAA